MMAACVWGHLLIRGCCWERTHQANTLAVYTSHRWMWLLEPGPPGLFNGTTRTACLYGSVSCGTSLY
jgi:hypothetical protein